MSLNVYDKTRQTLDKISGGGSAHRILNSSGNVVVQQPDLQFVGSQISNDSTNKKTIVDVNNYEDETTSVNYKLGVNNGLIFMEEI